MAITETFSRFVRSEQAAGIVLIVATASALALANSKVGPAFSAFWELPAGGVSLVHWINDGLMAIFFLLIGLELERELYVGELSEPKKASLPLVAAIGGMAAPALIHYAFNAGTREQVGFGIPMATDIAFALAAIRLLGSRIPAALNVFLVAFAVADDLGAIVIIALFYTSDLSAAFLGGAVGIWIVLVVLNRVLRVSSLAAYLCGGAVMWFLLLQSGVHATLAGVLLAFAIPFAPHRGVSPSHRLEHALHRPVAFLILPVFALANAGVVIDVGAVRSLLSTNSLGISMGLILGKPIGVTLLCFLATRLGICTLPTELRWSHIVGAGALGGIGYTMSIFITNLAFVDDPYLVNTSKIAILSASLIAAATGLTCLRFIARNAADDADRSTVRREE